jgi:hypothetical protein
MAGVHSAVIGPKVTDGNPRKCQDARGRLSRRPLERGLVEHRESAQAINHALHWTSPAKEALLSMTW